MQFGYLLHMGKCIVLSPMLMEESYRYNVGPCLHLHTYFLYMSSKGSDVSNYTFSKGRLGLITEKKVTYITVITGD